MSSWLRGAGNSAELPPAFLSLGMVVLDELRFPSKPTLHNVTGGSGAYSTLGACLVTSVAHSKTIGGLVLAGDDFPEEVVKSFESWKISLDIRRIPRAKSTRGLLKYEDNALGRKTFRYTTTPLQPTPKDIEHSAFLQSSAFHFLARPEDLQNQVADLLARRSRKNLSIRPLLVWEPAPPYCKLVNQEAHIQSCKLIDVFSPNHLELMRLFEDDDTPPRPFDRSIVEEYAKRVLFKSKSTEHEAVIIAIRAGEHGCLILSSRVECRWLPTYFDPGSERIMDPTGAGSCFLGAFTKILQETRDLTEAAINGAVAASFALEQFGLPTWQNVDGHDLWNGSTFESRLAEYTARL